MKCFPISNKPTYDLKDIHILDFRSEDRFVFFKSNKVFKFQYVFGNLENRSRVLRLEKEESRYVEYVVSATIDAGFCGHLVWKTKLTQAGLNLLESVSDPNQAVNKFQNCQQIHLFISPAGNYYDGTNQTDLEPDIIFEP